MKKALIIILIIIAVAIFGGLMNSQKNKAQGPTNTQTNNSNNNNPTKSNPSDPIACTMDAKACPDGSYVSRTGPRCEFALCPTTTKVPNSTKTSINKKIQTNGVMITPLKVIEDSRCPVDANCMWAGKFKLQTRIEIGSGVKEVELTQGVATDFMNKKITLTNVMPNADTSNPIAEKDYIFTFEVK